MIIQNTHYVHDYCLLKTCDCNSSKVRNVIRNNSKSETINFQHYILHLSFKM